MTPPVVVVTGGFGAVGSAVACRAEQDGAIVVRTGRSPGSGGMRHDVGDPDSWVEVVDSVLEAHGHLDVLVNAAGQLGGAAQGVETATADQWHALLDTHVVGSWLGCRELIRRRPDRPVAVVNIASTAGQLATPGMVAYGAMKAAVVHLTKSVALHCARAGIPMSCNAVAPALVDGGVRDDVLATVSDDLEQARQGYLSRVPLGRLVTPDEVAETVWYLATSGGGSLTGQTVAISGGLGLA